jgi:hypothetical protein
MTEPERRPPQLLCIVCGASITKGNYCSDRGFGPCEACEGMSLLAEEN